MLSPDTLLNNLDKPFPDLRYEALAPLSPDAMRALQDGRLKFANEKVILEMIALGKPLGDILREACIRVENVLQHDTRCSILLLGPEGNRVQVVAAPSLSQAFAAAIDRLPIGPVAGSCGTALYYNKRVIVEDIEHDPLWADYRTAALSCGLRACWSTPIPSASALAMGSFDVYCLKPRAPSAEDLAFISDITHLVGIAIQKDRVERSLQESEDRYRSVVTCMTEGIVVQSREGLILACNPSAERILRLAPNTLVGMTQETCFKRVIREDGAEIPKTELPSILALRTGMPILDLIVGVEMRDGAIVWLSENVLPIRRAGETEPSSVMISFTDISAAKETQQRLTFMATHDALTGLPNRAFLMERLADALEQLRDCDDDEHIAVLFLDLDRFKNVNDTIGHEAGDKLLQTVAGRLASCIRESDTLARLGGDEFVILADGFEELSSITTVCERILKAVAEPFYLSDNEYFLGVSIGVGIYPQDGSDGATLLRCADSAMYYAKECGRNNYQFFTRELDEGSQQRYLLEKNLRRALAHQEFDLHYQPKVDLSTGCIAGAEVLLRWNNPETGMPPSDFIPIAEETGMIVAIGQWVLEEACRQTANWRAHLAPQLRVAVNLSARQFQDSRLIGIVTDILHRTALPAEALELEITESLLMGDTEKLMPVFNALTRLGVGFSIDDFGTGYSSLAYLQRFPIESIKVDRSFIDGIPDNRDSVALTQAIIAMAHALDMRVIAEGVEQERQMEFLKRAGCQEIQGFYYSKPVTAEEFQRLLR